MNETTFNWQDLQLFLSVCRAGGLAGASSITGKSSPTLGRRMLALESSTGMELFTRHSHRYELTAEGENLLQIACKMESLAAPVNRTSSLLASKLIKVSAGSWMTQALCQRITDILTPDDPIRLRFISAEHQLDIAHRETLIGFRNQRPQSLSVATRKVGRVRFAGYAINQSIESWLMVNVSTPSARWLGEQTVRKACVEVTSPANALDLAKAGAGRLVLPTFVGDQQPELQRVTPLIRELSHDQWLVVHQDDRHHSAVRSVIDKLFAVASQLHATQR